MKMRLGLVMNVTKEFYKNELARGRELYLEGLVFTKRTISEKIPLVKARLKGRVVISQPVVVLIKDF